jgi:hypothetical protein
MSYSVKIREEVADMVDPRFGSAGFSLQAVEEGVSHCFLLARGFGGGLLWMGCLSLGNVIHEWGTSNGGFQNRKDGERAEYTHSRAPSGVVYTTHHIPLLSPLEQSHLAPRFATDSANVQSQRSYQNPQPRYL